MKISHLIVTWNNEEIIANCIDTLLQYTPFDNEVIVVDNDSADNTCDLIRSRYGDKVKLIEAGENLGFSKANNVALAHATGDYIFFVNPDVVFVEDILTPMVKILETQSQVGIVSPRLIYPDGRYQISTCNFPNCSKVFWDDLQMYRLLPKKKWARFAQAQYHGTENRFVDWTYGAAHLCRHEEVKAIGGYPNTSFMYGEDTEICKLFDYALKKKTYYLGDYKLIHLGGYSEGQVVNSKKVVYVTTACMCFVSKYHGKAHLACYRVMLFLASLFKYLIFSIKALLTRSQIAKNKKQKWGTALKTVLRYRGE